MSEDPRAGGPPPTEELPSTDETSQAEHPDAANPQVRPQNRPNRLREFANKKGTQIAAAAIAGLLVGGGTVGAIAAATDHHHHGGKAAFYREGFREGRALGHGMRHPGMGHGGHWGAMPPGLQRKGANGWAHSGKPPWSKPDKRAGSKKDDNQKKPPKPTPTPSRSH